MGTVNIFKYKFQLRIVQYKKHVSKKLNFALITSHISPVNYVYKEKISVK